MTREFLQHSNCSDPAVSRNYVRTVAAQSGSALPWEQGLEAHMTVVAVILLIAVIALIIALRKYIRDARAYREMYEQKQTKAFRFGGSKMSGDICQHLGTFAMLLEYEQVMTLSSTSSQGSLDLLAIGADSLDFIEFKKKGTDLSRTERKIKRLIEQKKVNYVVKDVEFPVGVCVSERVLKPSRIAASNLIEA